MNQEGRESQNIVTQAMQELAGMRGVNQTLRSLPASEAPPPLTDEQAIEEFRQSTGMIINSNGEVIGHDPNWQAPGVSSPRVQEPAPVPPPQEAPDVFGFGRKRHPLAEGSRVVLSKIKGIDLEAGDVIIDNMRYPLSEADIKQVARFCLGAMQQSLLTQIKELAQDYDVIDKPLKEAVSAPTDGGGEEVPGDAPAVDGDGEGGTA